MREKYAVKYILLTSEVGQDQSIVVVIVIIWWFIYLVQSTLTLSHQTGLDT